MLEFFGLTTEYSCNVQSMTFAFFALIFGIAIGWGAGVAQAGNQRPQYYDEYEDSDRYTKWR